MKLLSFLLSIFLLVLSQTQILYAFYAQNPQEINSNRSLENTEDSDLSIEISDNGQLKVTPSCPCPATVDILAKE